MGRSLRWHALSSLVVVALILGVMWLWGGAHGERLFWYGAGWFVLAVVGGVLTDLCFARFDRRRESRRQNE